MGHALHDEGHGLRYCLCSVQHNRDGAFHLPVLLCGGRGQQHQVSGWLAGWGAREPLSARSYECIMRFVAELRWRALQRCISNRQLPLGLQRRR